MEIWSGVRPTICLKVLRKVTKMFAELPRVTETVVVLPNPYQASLVTQVHFVIIIVINCHCHHHHHRHSHHCHHHRGHHNKRNHQVGAI